MRNLIRQTGDRFFTALAALSVVLMAGALVIILGPILAAGGSAVVFRATSEFRRLERDMHGRGSREAVEREQADVEAARKPVLDALKKFRRGLDTSALEDEARDVLRAYDAVLKERVAEGRITLMERLAEKRRVRKGLRDELIDAYESTDKNTVLGHLDAVRDFPDTAPLVGTPAERFFALEREYRTIAEHVDLTEREQYIEQLTFVQEQLTELFGPENPEEAAQNKQFLYGATRWNQVQEIIHKITWETTWVEVAEGAPRKKVLRSRAEHFEGTDLAAIFPLLEQNAEAMFNPRLTVYWQYFIDDSTPGHFFGGVGPEVLGTLLLTVLSMVFAVPVGVITAAYLVECTRENTFTRTLRMCINTLAGVPSIVFGLFGLAFFVLVLLPALGAPGKISILAGSLTLATLVLPVIIRASEEAIRAVPPSYKEASLAVGAGSFRTFVKVTLPAALPGILTGIILSMSRAAGETAPLLFTVAVYVGRVPRSLLEPTRTLSYGGYFMATGDTIAAKAPHQQYGIIGTLVILVLILNIVAILIRSRMSRKLRGH